MPAARTFPGRILRGARQGLVIRMRALISTPVDLIEVCKQVIALNGTLYLAGGKVPIDDHGEWAFQSSSKIHSYRANVNPGCRVDLFSPL